MPTLEEVEELDDCYWEGGTLNGVNGNFVIGPNGNSIFIPFAGDRVSTSLDYEGSGVRFWSGSQLDYDNISAYCLYCHWGGSSLKYQTREYGFTVRPVSD